MFPQPDPKDDRPGLTDDDAYEVIADVLSSTPDLQDVAIAMYKAIPSLPAHIEPPIACSIACTQVRAFSTYTVLALLDWDEIMDDDDDNRA